jgi:hypothetical protein
MNSLNDDWLDDDLPMEESEAAVACPYCGAIVELSLDTGGGVIQSYVEDCDVCCRPMQLTVRWDETGAAHVDATTES